MIRMFVISLLMLGTLMAADEPSSFKLSAPEDWGGETISLPPGFAPDMKLKGLEHIRFAPGMMKPASETFFSYAFVFDLQPKPALTEEVIREEFLKYYRGLCKAVLNGKAPEVEPADFTLELKEVKPETKPSADEKNPGAGVLYTGVLNWVEPFATKKLQKLNIEIQTWSQNDRNFLFACVSPQPRDNAIWKQLHAIRDGYLKKAAKSE